MAGTQRSVEEILATRPALFVTELAAATGAAAPDLDTALSRLSSRLLVADHHLADPHLHGDFRVVALRDDPPPGGPGPSRAPAERRAADHWSAFLREVAQRHRCA